MPEGQKPQRLITNDVRSMGARREKKLHSCLGGAVSLTQLQWLVPEGVASSRPSLFLEHSDPASSQSLRDTSGNQPMCPPLEIWVWAMEVPSGPYFTIRVQVRPSLIMWPHRVPSLIFYIFLEDHLLLFPNQLLTLFWCFVFPSAS